MLNNTPFTTAHFQRLRSPARTVTHFRIDDDIVKTESEKNDFIWSQAIHMATARSRWPTERKKHRLAGSCRQQCGTHPILIMLNNTPFTTAHFQRLRSPARTVTHFRIDDGIVKTESEKNDFICHRRSTWRLQGHAGLQRGRNTASQEGAASNVDTSNPDNVKQYTVHDCTFPAFALSSTHGYAFQDRR